MAETRKRGRKPRSSFYYTRWYKVRLNEERAAEVLNVTPATIGQWDIDGNELAERYLLLWDKKRFYGEWSGFVFSRGTLRYKRRQWTPETLKHSD